MLKGIFLFLFLLSVTICTKLLAFDIYKIPSSSMENMLYSGDVIVVNKLKYGPKLPQSPFEIPWVNLFFYKNKNVYAKIKETWWDYSRWCGTTTIKQGDVFVFNSVWNKDYILVKRCVALPGDVLSIKKGEVYTNYILYNSPKTVKNNCIDFMKKNIDVYNSKERLLKTPTNKWTLDDMGPIIIPKRGMVIKLNPDSFMLYEKIINLFEKNKITEVNGNYFLNGKKASTYKFKLNYYFMMGDNRKGTIDSRRWGFLPESNIIGKVNCILFSNKSEMFQWDRLFKIL